MMHFLIFLGKRVAAIIVTTCVIIALSYTLMYYAPGGMFQYGNTYNALATIQAENPVEYSKLMKQWKDRYGLELPLYEQVGRYIVDSFTLNFGFSFENPTTPILQTIKSAFPISFLLAFGSVVLATLIGVPLGILAALKQGTWIDSFATTISTFGQAIPSYVFGFLLVLLFGIFIPIFPVNGWGSPLDAVLPIMALAAGNISVLTRYMRGSLIETMRQNYIRTARAKGIANWKIILKHALRNSLIAIVTILGPTLAFTVVGTVWVEQVFGIPGLGSVLSSAFSANDYPLAVTSIFILSMLVMIMNLFVDIAYQMLDPRVRLES